MSSLNKSAAEYLSALTYRPDAKRRVCFLPLSSIYWDDEIPDLASFMKLTDDGRTDVLRLFALRLKHWDGETLQEDDRHFWNSARLQVASCPLFQRLELSAPDRAAREEVERACAKELEAFFADADQVTVTKLPSGLEEFSATFDLTKSRPPAEEKKPWWKRFFGKR